MPRFALFSFSILPSIAMKCYKMISFVIEGQEMEVIITDWALQSHLELKDMFTDHEYRELLRPDACLLKEYPSHPKFSNPKFWGPSKDKSGKIIRHGYKMKWHNMGSGGIQLRLLVVITNDTAYLCNAYVKDNENTDFREMAKLKIKIQLIKEEKFIFRGRLS